MSDSSTILHRISLLLVMLAVSTGALATCESAEHRAFDFWLGDWEVRTPDGKLAGVNHIEVEYGGCVLHEHYSGSGEYRGESLNIYDAGRKRWHQSWVDNTGLLLLLDGGLRNDSMVLEGKTTSDDGQETLHRITWTPNADGSVRQFWQSTDSDGQWQTAFDGLYTRK